MEQMTIVDVDDGAGHVEQVILTNDEDYHGLSFMQEAAADDDDFVGLRYGKYKPLFNGLIVIGPQFGKLLSFLFSLLVVGTVVGFLFGPICTELGTWVFWLGQVLVILCIILLLYTSVTDPGVIPRDFNLSQYLFEIRDSPTPPPARNLWCRKCKAPRPFRSYHCQKCEICIHRQDMHLCISGACVGSRNFRQYLVFNLTSSILSFYLIGVGVLLIMELLQKNSAETAFMRSDFNLSCFLIFCGAILISFPQTGFIMFVYRLYLVTRNRTVREEYRFFISRGSEVMANPFDKGLVLNIWEFLMKEPEPSCFRKKKNQILDNSWRGRRWRVVSFVDNNNNNQQSNQNEILFFPTNNFLHLGHHQHNFGNIGFDQNSSYLETESIRQNLNSKAKIKSHQSALLHAALYQPSSSAGAAAASVGTGGIRFRRSLYPKPLDLLQQQLKLYQLNQTLPKSLKSFRKLGNGSRSMSESSLTQANNNAGQAAIVNQARAWQIQQIIGCVLRRDRRGLVELSRRINVAGLIGMDHFDPDDIQMIELNNGLPLLSSRTQNNNNNNVRRGGQRPTQTVLGIPQMIASGLIPSLRSQQQQAAASLALARLRDDNNSNNNCNNRRNQIQFDMIRNRRQFTTSVHIRPSVTTASPPGHQVTVNDSVNNQNQSISRHRHRHFFNLINNVRNNNSQNSASSTTESSGGGGRRDQMDESNNNDNGRQPENSRSTNQPVSLFSHEDDQNEER